MPEERQLMTNESKKFLAIPDSYDGSSDFHVWLAQFKACAQASRWTEEEKKEILPTRLTGKAFMAYLELAPDQHLTFDEHTDALRDAIQPKEYQSTLRMELRQKKKGALQDLDEYYQQLLLLVQRAYPDTGATTRMELLKEQFIEGLPWDLKNRVVQAGPRTAVEALRVAREQSAWLASAPPQQTTDMSLVFAKLDDLARQIKMATAEPAPVVAAMGPTGPSQMSAALPFQGRVAGNGGMTCFTCGKPGHRARECRSGPPRPQYASTNRRRLAPTAYATEPAGWPQPFWPSQQGPAVPTPPAQYAPMSGYAPMALPPQWPQYPQPSLYGLMPPYAPAWPQPPVSAPLPMPQYPYPSANLAGMTPPVGTTTTTANANPAQQALNF